jgi:putative phosphoribosyl transferase
MSDISIPLGERRLEAALQVPRQPGGVVVFVHGSGVDRHDVRDRYVARRLRQAGLATLQPELLDPWQTTERHNAFDIALQCSRLLEAVRWLDGNRWARGLPLGVFGSGIGAGVALMAAAKMPGRVAAVICRGGRPDTALFWLPRVKAPTLLMVEGLERPYLLSYENLGCTKELVVVPTESQRFAEPAALDAVGGHACRWFSRYLAVPHSHAA